MSETFIFFALSTSLWPVLFSVYIVRLPFINPITLEFIFNFPVIIATILIGPIFLIDDCLNNNGYIYALLVTVVQNLSFFFGAIFFYKISNILNIERIFIKNTTPISRFQILYAEKFFILIFIVAFYLTSSAEFGFLNWIQNPRLGYQMYRSGQGHWYALSISSLSAAITCRFFSYKNNPKIFRTFIFYIPLAFLLGSKAYLLSIFIFALISLWFYKPKKVNLLLFLVLPISFAVLIFNFSYSSDSFSYIQLFQYFDYYKNASDYYSDYLNNKIHLFDGEIIFSSLWEYIPRSIYPEKPYIYGGILVADIFFPGAALAGHTPAFGAGVLQFADFGWVGLVLLSFLSVKSIIAGAGSYLIFRCNLINVRKLNLASIALLLISFSPQFGIFFPGLYYWSVLILSLAVIRMFQKKTIASI